MKILFLTGIRSVVCLSSSFALIASLVAAPVRAHANDGGQVGPYLIGHTSFVTTKASGRPVAVEVWYPAANDDTTRTFPPATYVMDPYYRKLPDSASSDWESMGYDRAYEEPLPPQHHNFPLVMFSSGFTMPAWAYLYVGTRLASHGFIVAVVQHFSEATWPWDGYEGIAFIAYNRPRDISFALSEMLQRSRTAGDLLYGMIDEKHIIASGHSYGGYAALVEVAGDDQVCDARDIIDTGETLPPEACQPSPPDLRFSALMTLDASAQVLRFREMARTRVPTLNLGEASYEWVGLKDFLTFVSRPHAAISQQALAVRVDIVDSDHFSFSNECDGVRWLFRQGAISADDMAGYYEPIFCQAKLSFDEGHRIITKYMVAFLKTLVLHESEQIRFLTPANVLRYEPNVRLYWTERCRTPDPVLASQFRYRTNMTGGCAVGDKDPEAFFSSTE